MKFLIALLIPALAFGAPSSTRELTGDHVKNGAAVLTFPSTTDRLVGRATTDTFTNKTFDVTSNTLTNIANANIGAGAAIDFSKLAVLTNGNVLIGNVSNVATSVAVTGDVLITNAGVTSYNNIVPLAKGGTANGSLVATSGGVLVTDGTKAVNSGAGTTGQVLMAGTPATFATLPAPTVQKFTTTGAQSAAMFTIPSSNVGAGDHYADAGAGIWIVLQACTSCTTVYMSGTTTFTPGLMVRVSGTGDNFTPSKATVMATYTPTSGTKMVKVTLVGGGGGSGGCATCTSSQCCATAGAGSGAVSVKWITNPSAMFYNVGTAGAAGVAGNNIGVAGVASALVSATQTPIVANGGGQSVGNAASSVVATFAGGTGGVQAVASGGDLNIPGNSGSIGVCTSVSASVNWGGNGGSTPGFGSGGIGGTTNANAGQLYGGGGAGTVVNPGISATAGNVGAAGLTLFEEYTQ